MEKIISIMSLKETLSNESVRTFVAWFYYFWFEYLLFEQLEYLQSQFDELATVANGVSPYRSSPSSWAKVKDLKL